MVEKHHIHHLLRSQDAYAPEMDRESFIKTYFPESLPSLVLSLSEITSAFYGIALQKAAILNGSSMIEPLSNAILYELGRLRTKRTLAVNPKLERDARGILITVLASIFTSSPEYRFSVETFTPGLAKVVITGKDRYHRITSRLGIDNFLQWPVVQPFFEGIIAELQLEYTASFEVIQLNGDSECHYHITIARQQELRLPAGALGLNIAMTPPFFSIPDKADIQFAGNCLYAPIGNSSAFQGENTADIIQIGCSLEAYNYHRLQQPAGPQYLLAEKARLIRTNHPGHNTTYTAILQPTTTINRKKQATIAINDGEHTVYNLIISYDLLSEQVMNKKLSHLKKSTPLPPVSRLQWPAPVELPATEPDKYSFVLGPFDTSHCAGHFPGFPIVPLVYMYRLTTRCAMAWLQSREGYAEDKIIIDNVELFPVLPMPPEMEFLARTHVIRLTKKYFKFTTCLFSRNDTEKLYAHIITDMLIQ